MPNNFRNRRDRWCNAAKRHLSAGDLRDRFTLQAERDFRASVRPVYRNSDREPLPQHVGSCLLLRVDGARIVATAAHIFDQFEEYTLYVAGPPRAKPVPIIGGAGAATPKPGGERKADHFDWAFWLPPATAVVAMGDVEFLDVSRMSEGPVISPDRFYTAIGYPVSRNKKAINHATKSISTRISMYTANVEAMPALAAELKVSGDEHLFLSFEERSFTSDGASENTFGPKGLSGGALLDLGEFTSPESYERDPTKSALLAGMVIEYYKEHRALVAVRIGTIVNGIRLALARRWTITVGSRNGTMEEARFCSHR
jgi:hypothetical protein